MTYQSPDELDRRAKALLADPWNDDARDEAMTLRALAAEAREWAREWGGGVGGVVAGQQLNEVA